MYSAQITRANPTCIILLLDQSGSMSDPSVATRPTRSLTLSPRSSITHSRSCHPLHETEEVRNYYYISIIGYGRSVGPAFAGPFVVAKNDSDLRSGGFSAPSEE
jgi:hypothetical protein